jgi:hypothetical protein
MRNAAIIRVIGLNGFFEIYSHNKTNSIRNTRSELSAMTKIIRDLALKFAACEDAYEQATQEGYAENPAVIAAIAALKTAWRALYLANCHPMTTQGFFSVKFAAIRRDRARRAAREACIKLHVAIKEAAAEHRLYNRCLTMANQPPDAVQAGDAVTAQQNGRLRLLA